MRTSGDLGRRFLLAAVATALAACGTCPHPTQLLKLADPLVRNAPSTFIVDVGTAIGTRVDGPLDAKDPLVLSLLAPTGPSSTWTVAQPLGDRRITSVQVVGGKLSVTMHLPADAATGAYTLAVWPSGKAVCGAAFEQPLTAQ